MTEIKRDFMPVYQKEKAFEAQIQQDLKTLVAKIEKTDGVDRAAILPAKDIIVDEKVRWKCIHPICFGYNTSAVCPPHTPPVDECERVIHSFRYAIVFQLGVPAEDFTGEAWANSMGYRQAVSFQGGPCTGLITGPCTGLRLGTESARGSGDTVQTCAVLRGKGCRNFLKVRPAMEAMAIDVIGTIQPLGWDMVYIGGSTNNPADIPCASTVGLLLVV
jgi:predicted metal-binding protein